MSLTHSGHSRSATLAMNGERSRPGTLGERLAPEKAGGGNYEWREPTSFATGFSSFRVAGKSQYALSQRTFAL